MVQTESLPAQKLNHAHEAARPVRDPGSFRDPSGFVCHLGDEVYRAVDDRCAALVDALSGSGLLTQLQQEAGLVPTRLVREHDAAHTTLRQHFPHAHAFLQHEKIPFLSYPYEWPRSMLADAALCCLDLQILLIEHELSLKDASVYNIQFARGLPVFIDVPSIEAVTRRDVWTGLHQFYRMFLFPLLMSRFGRTTLKEYFLSNLEGADLDNVYDRFGFLGSLRASLWLDVWLPYQLQRCNRSNGTALRNRIERNTSDPRPLLINLRRLRRKVDSLCDASRGTSRWIDYAGHNSYSEDDTARKKAFLTRFLEAHPLTRILDIGCNTGRYAELAARRGVPLVAIDTDESCVDTLHRRTRKTGLDILPLVMDITNPSPGIGFRNSERQPFTSRASFDCVFALALVHHLLVTSRLPLESIRDMLADLTSAWAIVEFVAPDDPMFVQILGAREDIYRHVTLDRFLEVFGTRFHVRDRQPVAHHRTLVAFEKR